MVWALLSSNHMDSVAGFKGKPSMLGAASGAVAGLVAITPACGFVGVKGALLIGVVVSILCFWGVTGLKKLLGADDALDNTQVALGLLKLREQVRSYLREPVRLRAGVRQHCTLLECKDRVDRSSRAEDRLDRLPALRVRKGVARPLGGHELDPFVLRRNPEKLGTGAGRHSQLEMRRPVNRQRATAQKGTAQIGAAAARAAHETPRWARQRPVVPVEDAGLHEARQRRRAAGHVQLESRRPVERVPFVRPDLGVDPERAQQCERAARDRRRRQVEMQRHLPPTAEVQVPRRMEQRRELGEPVASAGRRDGCELSTDVCGERRRRIRHNSTPSSESSRRLRPTPESP